MEKHPWIIISSILIRLQNGPFGWSSMYLWRDLDSCFNIFGACSRITVSDRLRLVMASLKYL